ncbi:hypothetical protein [Vulgatibacter sp.]|uniref:hypothetical protein n=1 Tax=Vulgatibacter sp. TaxID=1971226 RepID=UPI0035660EE5
MRRLALPLLASALLASGCLVPQEIEEMEPPRVGNAAPRIVLLSPDSTRVVISRHCPTVTFALEGIEDFDREDSLEIRWFVDYGPDRTVPSRVATIPASPEMVDGIRPGPAEAFVVRPNNWVQYGHVRIEAVVSDGFDPDPEAEPANRAVLAGKDWDLASWDLIVTDESCPLL